VKLKPTVRIPIAVCPDCGAKLDRSNGITSHYPEEGDINVCAHCAGVATFNNGLQLEAWPADKPLPQEVREAQALIRRLRS